MTISLFCPILEYYNPQGFNLADSYKPLNAEVSTKPLLTKIKRVSHVALTNYIVHLHKFIL